MVYHIKYDLLEKNWKIYAKGTTFAKNWIKLVKPQNYSSNLLKLSTFEGWFESFEESYKLTYRQQSPVVHLQ